MASGTFTAEGGTFSIANNSCLSVMQAADNYHHNIGYPNITAVSCSTDPAAVGTTINFNSGTWTISAITATAEDPPVQNAEVFSVLIIVVAIVACFFAAVLGYRDGKIV